MYIKVLGCYDRTEAELSIAEGSYDASLTKDQVANVGASAASALFAAPRFEI